jgi:hypothetical protein
VKTIPAPTPPMEVGLSASEAKKAFDSPQALTAMLEKRWPVAAIQQFCIPERRHDNGYQNLVAMGVVWEGKLYENVATGFDEIRWYATTVDGRADLYSLGVKRGSDFWLLEIESEKTVQLAPQFTPDPKRRGFVGHQ